MKKKMELIPTNGRKGHILSRRELNAGDIVYCVWSGSDHYFVRINRIDKDHVWGNYMTQNGHTLMANGGFPFDKCIFYEYTLPTNHYSIF